MLILLPPSETKRDGGVAGSALALDALSFPELTSLRTTTVDATVALAADPEAALAALRSMLDQTNPLADEYARRIARLYAFLDTANSARAVAAIVRLATGTRPRIDGARVYLNGWILRTDALAALSGL